MQIAMKDKIGKSRKFNLSHIFDKKFVKATILLKYFSSESEFYTLFSFLSHPYSAKITWN